MWSPSRQDRRGAVRGRPVPEILHFFDGDPLQILLSKDKVNTFEVTLGRNIQKDQKYYYEVKAETWFSMYSLGKWSLIGCIVAPAFEYTDFELAPPNWEPGNK